MVTLFKNIFFKQAKCICHKETVNLSEASTGQRFRVACLCGEEGICHRLREMGFCESSVVQKIADSGSLICRVCDAKVVLSKELAQNIMVKDICPCQDHGHA